MSKRADRFVALLFALFLLLLFALNLYWPDKSFSDKENRYLQTIPSFSLPSLLRGEYMSKMEDYCADQFILRDEWIALKARLELLQGKQENNGIFLCAGERLIEPMILPDISALDRQIDTVNAFAESVDVPVVLGLVPTSAEIYRNLLPEGVRNDSQHDAIHYIYSRAQLPTADILGAMEAHCDDYIYYRTDHHWTSLGARWGYAALADIWGVDASADYSARIVSDSFCGTAWSSSGFFWVRPDTMEILVDDPGVTVERYDNASISLGKLYAEDMLDTKDKYRFFLGGNTPCAVIRTSQADCPSLLIIRDSFADSLVPFLLRDHAQIHLLDLRYYRDSVQDYITKNDIDRVLILYSTSDFFSDNNLALLSR